MHRKLAVRPEESAHLVADSGDLPEGVLVSDLVTHAANGHRDLFESELRLAQTRRNELLALVQLYRALGGGWQA